MAHLDFPEAQPWLIGGLGRRQKARPRPPSKRRFSIFQPGDNDNFRGDAGNPVGWGRYGTSCPLLKAGMKPPMELICKGTKGAQLSEHELTECVVRVLGGLQLLSFRLSCQLQGSCVRDGVPSSPPAPPGAPSPRADVCGDESLASYGRCWRWLSYATTWLLLVLGLLLPLLLRLCIRSVARASVLGLWDGRLSRLGGGDDGSTGPDGAPASRAGALPSGRQPLLGGSAACLSPLSFSRPPAGFGAPAADVNWRQKLY
jgi:hypothetical protein